MNTTIIDLTPKVGGEVGWGGSVLSTRYSVLNCRERLSPLVYLEFVPRR